MKRWIGSVALAVVSAAAIAQSPFTIVRPADGSKVREQVRILIPKGSIPSGGYVGVFVDGKFVEATVPVLNGKYHEYVLDTKARGIKDSDPGKPLKLELVLYVDFNEQPRIVDRSSVDVYVGNKANIPVPSEGVKLRYGFKTGKEMVYTMEQRVAISTMTESQNRAGGRPAELPLDSSKVRLLYAVDNAYTNGDGLLRLQALPNRGKDYTVIQTSLDNSPTVYYEQDFAPIYMRVTNTGRQVFGSVPFYSPIPGSSNEGSVETNLYAAFPLPALPPKAVRPGDSWESKFLRGALDMDNIYEVNSLINSFKARGEFVGVEWEMGHPCARIRNIIAVGTTSDEGKKLKEKGTSFGDDEKVSTEENIWFALDTKQIVKILRDTTIEGKMDASALGFGSGGGAGTPAASGAAGGAGPRASGMSGAGGPGPGAPAGGGGGGKLGGLGGAGGGLWMSPLGAFFQGAPPPGFNIPPGVGSRGRGGQGPSGPPQFGGPSGPGGFPGQGAGAGAGSQFQAAQNVFVRIRLQQIYVLEK